MQNVDTAIAGLEMDGLVGIILRGGLSPDIAEGDAEAFGQREEGAADLCQYGRHFGYIVRLQSIRRRNEGQTRRIYHNAILRARRAPVGRSVQFWEEKKGKRRRGDVGRENSGTRRAPEYNSFAKQQ